MNQSDIDEINESVGKLRASLFQLRRYYIGEEVGKIAIIIDLLDHKRKDENWLKKTLGELERFDIKKTPKNVTAYTNALETRNNTCGVLFKIKQRIMK